MQIAAAAKQTNKQKVKHYSFWNPNQNGWALTLLKLILDFERIQCDPLKNVYLYIYLVIMSSVEGSYDWIVQVKGLVMYIFTSE